jgi:ubiquinol-cytochrome c reductase cytochrome b subunit
MSAWSGDTLPVRIFARGNAAGATGRGDFSGQAVPQLPFDWRAQGGERGPALDAVATRMTPDQMRYKVVTGGGNMPAYGKNLSPAEIEALVSFLETLHPANEPPAFDASQQAVQSSTALRAPRTWKQHAMSA